MAVQARKVAPDVGLARLARLVAEHRRGDQGKRRRLPAELRVEAVAAVKSGSSYAAVARAVGASDWTVSRWASAAEVVPKETTKKIRELTLVGAARLPAKGPAATDDCTDAGVASVCFPNGLRLIVPVTTLTVTFVGQILAAGGVK